MGFNRPSKIQVHALPLMLRNGPDGHPRNVVAQSQSGTGKTAAFVLTVLSRIDPKITKPQALILAPSRELAAQIAGVVKQMGQFTNVNVCQALKGTRSTPSLPLAVLFVWPSERALTVRLVAQSRAWWSRWWSARPAQCSTSSSAAACRRPTFASLCSTKPIR